jgi:hypothetical protein
MEVDSVNAMIENKILKHDSFYLPMRYAEISESAQNKDPYDVK